MSMHRLLMVVVILLFTALIGLAQDETPTPSEIPAEVPSATPLPTETPTEIPTLEPTFTPTFTETPTETATEFPSETPTLEFTPTETSTPDGTPTETSTEIPTLMPTPEPLPLAYSANFDAGIPIELTTSGAWLPIAIDSTNNAIQADKQGGRVRYTGGIFGDAEISAKVYILRGTFSLIARENAGTSYTATLNADDSTVKLFKNGELVNTGSLVLTPDTWITFSLRAVGNDLIVSMDGVALAVANDGMPLSAGLVGFEVAELSAVRVDDFAVYGVVAGEVPTATPQVATVTPVATVEVVVPAPMPLDPPAGCPFTGINMVSVDSEGVQGNSESIIATISNDGRYTLFHSVASNLVANDINNNMDVFRYDRQTCITVLVSGGSDIVQNQPKIGNISGDGDRIVLTARSISVGGTDNQVFLYTVSTNTTQLVSSNNSGTYTAGSISGLISANGEFVFISTARQLAATDTNSTTDIYLREIATGINTLVTTISSLNYGNAVISDTGRYVVFRTTASYLPADTDSLEDFYRFDLVTSNVTLVSPCYGAVCPAQYFLVQDISADGDQILIIDFDFGGLVNTKVIIYTISTDTYTQLPLTQKQITNAKFSSDGNTVAYDGYDPASGNTIPQVFAYRRSLNQGVLIAQSLAGVAGNDMSIRPDISGDGSSVVFDSIASNLVANDTVATCDTNFDSIFTDSCRDIFVAPITFPSIPDSPTSLVATTNLATSINLLWVNGANYNTVKVERRNDALGSFVEIASLPSTATTYSNTGFTCGTSRQYRIRGYNSTLALFSNYSDVVTGNTNACLVTAAPVLVAPTNNAITKDTTPTFDWNAPLNGSTYEIQVSTNNTFTAMVSGYPTLGVSATDWTQLVDLPDGNYFWRVKAYNNAPTPVGGPFSAIFKFTINTVALTTAPTLTNPANLATINTVRPALAFSAVTGAAKYKLQIARGSAFGAFGDIVETYESVVTTVPFPAGFNRLEQGTYFWRVLAMDAAGNDDTAAPPAPWSIPAQFTVDLRTSPANNAVLPITGTVTFTWAAAVAPPVGAVNYTVEVELDDANGIFDTAEATCVPTTSPLTCQILGVEEGKHLWRVLVNNANPSVAPRTFFVSPAAPAAPTLIVPAANASAGENLSLEDGTRNTWLPGVFFNWSTATGGGSPFTYLLEISTSSTFATVPVYSAVNIPGSSINLTSLPDGDYYWRVRTINVNGLAGAFSAGRKLIVDRAPLPTAPNLLLPAASPAAISASRPTFTWSAVPGAKRYKLYVSVTNNNFADLVGGYESRFVGNGITVPPLTFTGTNNTNILTDVSAIQGAFQWKVEAFDAADNMISSAPRDSQVFIGTAPLQNEIKVAPFTGRNIQFTWAAVAGATGYTLFVDSNSNFTTVGNSYGTSAVTSYTLLITPSDIYYWKVVPSFPPLPALQGVAGPITPRSFAVTTTAMTAPTLLSPLNAAITNSPTPNYSWYDPNTISAVTRTYEVQVSKLPSFPPADSYFMFQTTTESLTQSPALDTPTPGKLYYWRVRAKYETANGFVFTTPFSVVRTFTLDTVAPGIPTLTSPVLNAVSRTASPTFTWTASAGIAATNGYTLEVASTSNFTQDFQTATLSTNSLNTLVSSLLTPLPQKNVYWRVRARDAAGNVSADSTTGQFAVFLGTSPVAAFVSPTTTINFVFNTIKGHTGGYQIIVDADGNFASGSIPSLPAFPAVTATSATIPMTLPTGAYVWKVVKNGQPATVDNAVINFAIASLNNVPTLNLPVEDDNFVNIEEAGIGINLSWNEPVGNSGLALLGYQYQTATNSTFTTGLVEDLVIGATTVAINRPNGMYFWRVRALYAGFVFNPPSATATFTVDTTPPAIPNITAPTQNAIISTARPKFDWGVVPTAVRYEVTIDSDTYGDGSPALEPLITAATFTLPDTATALGQSSHLVQVKAFDAAGNSTVSTPRNFNVFIGTAPLDKQVFTVTSVPFSWAAVVGATGYQLDIHYDASMTSPIPSNPFLPALATGLTRTVSLPLGTYYWRVTPIGVSTAAIPPRVVYVVPTGGLKPPMFNVIRDDDRVNAGETPTVFTWGNAPAVTGTTVSGYRLQFGTINTFTPAITTTVDVFGANFYDNTMFLSNGTFYARVATLYTGGGVSPFSPTRTFIIDTIAPNPPTINLPAEGATVSTARPTFTWGAVPTATRYEVRVDGTLVSPPTLATTTFTLPNTATARAQGAHTVTVKAIDLAGNETTSATRNFNVFVGTTPLFGEVKSGAVAPVNVTFNWATVFGATIYQLQIFTDAALTIPFGSPITVAAPILTKAVLLPFGTYYWRVKPSTEATITVAGRKLIVSNIPPTPVIAVQPFTPDAIIGTTEVASAAVSWSAIPAAPAHVALVSYEVQVAPTAAFVPAQTTTFTTSSTSQSLSTITGNGVKHVRVRAVYNLPSGDVVNGAYTAVKTYTLDTVAPTPAPNLTTPINTAVLGTRTPAFVWGAVATTTRYKVEIDVTNSFSTPIITLNSATTTVTVPTGLALSNGTYYWRVTPYDVAGNVGTPSATRTFVVNAP